MAKVVRTGTFNVRVSLEIVIDNGEGSVNSFAVGSEMMVSGQSSAEVTEKLTALGVDSATVNAAGKAMVSALKSHKAHGK